MNDNWLGGQVEGGAAMIVAARAEVGSLRDTDVVANVNVFDVVDPHFLSDPTVIADRETPGEFDFHVGFEDDPRADLPSRRTIAGSIS